MAELVPYLRGWRGYFGFCQTPEVLVGLIRWVVCAFALLFGDNGKLHAVARAALLALGVRPRKANDTAGSGLGPGILRELKLSLWGLLMPTSNRLVFPHS
jgi:RNA-directed DNA polymerase